VLIIAILLLIVGLIGLIMSAMMFGDIGIAAAIGALAAILAGIGFFIVNKRLPKP
jgi:positive regulator of sigma E activity